MLLPDAETIKECQNVETEKEEKYLIFSIFDRQYAFPSRFIGEIALFDSVYPLPLLPSYIPGVINRYSVPYALFDIGLLLFTTPSPRKKMLVLKDDIDRIAFLIDDVSGIVDVPQGDLFSVEQSAESGDLAEAVSASFSWNGADVFVLDIQRILARISDEAAL
jgi:purine-binding chemotaxis protein CheW